MSNTTQETQQFIRLANTDTNKNPKLILDKTKSSTESSFDAKPARLNGMSIQTSEQELAVRPE